ncbi:hypothetical protein MNB_SV-15-1380 [hydrothermal vent metagenome]|uniref:Uncharacterized protein n=1 Tax=hydrothermal vent metagenome TaxID=652676 RepID=A0A1W1EI85_9ZZZZ
MVVLHHKGVAMIELIFAIVIMAIVLLSAPTLINQSVKSSFVGFQQESINAIATHMNLILTKNWDVGNANPDVLPVILTVNAGDDDLNMVNLTTARRAGTDMTSNRSFVSTMGGTIAASPSSNFGKDKDTIGTELDDIDDYNDYVTTLKGDAIGGGVNYIDVGITIKTTVSYGSDKPSDGKGYINSEKISFNNPFGNTLLDSTNIKLISAVLTNPDSADELKKNIRLSAFMCNIGTYTLAIRDGM